jgi:hypothetical protein
MNKTDIERERRVQRRLEALGTNNPRCIHCGEDDPFCLEVHELGGREFGDYSTIECRNCHRKLEDRRKDHPQQLSPSPSTDESLVHILYGIADALMNLSANAPIGCSKESVRTRPSTKEGCDERATSPALRRHRRLISL